MADDKKYVAFLYSYYDALRELPRNVRADVTLAIIEYGFDGIEPKLSGAAKMAFKLIKPTLDSSEKMRRIANARYSQSENPQDAQTPNTQDAPADSSHHAQSDVPHNAQPQNTQDAQSDVSHAARSGFPQDAQTPNTQDALKGERERDRDRTGERDRELYSPPIVPPTGDGDGDDAEDPLFAAFWAAYPKKVGKGAVRKAFLRLPKAKQRLLLPALERQKLSVQWKRDNGKYIPNPLTWINQGRWEDPEPTDTGPQTYNPFMASLLEDDDE